MICFRYKFHEWKIDESNIHNLIMQFNNALAMIRSRHKQKDLYKVFISHEDDDFVKEKLTLRIYFKPIQEEQ